MLHHLLLSRISTLFLLMLLLITLILIVFFIIMFLIIIIDGRRYERGNSLVVKNGIVYVSDEDSPNYPVAEASLDKDD